MKNASYPDSPHGRHDLHPAVGPGYVQAPHILPERGVKISGGDTPQGQSVSDWSLRVTELKRKKKTCTSHRHGWAGAAEFGNIECNDKPTVLQDSLQLLNTFNSDVGLQQPWLFFRPLKSVAKKSHRCWKRTSHSQNSLEENSTTVLNQSVTFVCFDLLLSLHPVGPL